MWLPRSPELPNYHLRSVTALLSVERAPPCTAFVNDFMLHRGALFHGPGQTSRSIPRFHVGCFHRDTKLAAVESRTHSHEYPVPIPVLLSAPGSIQTQPY